MWRSTLKDEEFEIENKGNAQDVPQTIVTLIKNNPKISREDMALQLGLSVKTIGRYIAKLPNIKYVGSGYSAHWEIVE